jgi:predicted nucleic acid-binding protein
MTAAVLLDTNILVYFVDPRDEIRQNQAIDLLNTLGELGIGRLSAQNLAEFMNSTRKLSAWITHAEVVAQVRRWVNIFPIFDLTPMVVLEAARGVQEYQLSYYDAQIWAAARLNQVALLFSEDFQDGAVLEGVRFANPFAPAFDLADWV